MDKPGIEAERQFDLARATSLAITGLLGNHGIKAKVKWPNDIYVKGKKIAGLLIENCISGQKLTNTIIGIGLNVNQRCFDLPEATSFRLLTGRETDRAQLLEELYFLMENHLQNARTKPKDLHRAFDKQLWKAGQMATFTIGGEKKNGQVEGTDSYGRIMIRVRDGKPRAYGMDEIKLKED